MSTWHLRMWPHLEIASLQIELVKMGSLWMRVGPESSVSGALIRRWNLEAETDTRRGDGYVMMEAEVQMLQLHAPECQGLMATIRKDPPHEPSEGLTPLTP